MREPSESDTTGRRRLRDRYVLGSILGQGTQGTTYDAIDEGLGRKVAVKEFRIRGARSWKDVELAEREASVLASLEHPNLPRYFDHFEEDGCLYLVTEKIEGESIAAARARGASFSTDDVLRFLEEVDAVLAYLQSRAPPIIHRDIKPQNVLRRPDGSFALVDFGSVRDHLRPEGGSTVVGTFGFMAPEQFQGRAVPATDVYAVGATALCMLTGRPPEELPHRGLRLDVSASLGKPANDPMVRLLSRLTEPDPDVRAPRIQPLLREYARASRADAGARAPRADASRGPAERRRPRPRRGAQSPDVVIPEPVWRVFHAALAIADVAVGVALRAIVPIVLTLLSILFGPNLRRTAHTVSEAGRRAQKAVRRARRAGLRAHREARTTHGSARQRGPRVEDSPPPRRVRVGFDVGSEPEYERERAEDERHEHAPHRRR